MTKATKTNTPVQEQTELPMQYDVRVYLARSDGALRANASVNINGAFAISNVRVLESSKGLFVSMPQYKGRNGEYKDICFPCTKESRQAFDSAVLGAYEQTMAQSQSAKQQEAPAQQQEQSQQSQPAMAGM